jgi:hypothetical protein
MKLLARENLRGRDDEVIPLFVVVHQQFTTRLHYYRSMEGVEKDGFKCPGDEGEMTPENVIWQEASNAFKEGYSLVAVGRADPDESAEDAMASICKVERVIAKSNTGPKEQEPKRGRRSRRFFR